MAKLSGDRLQRKDVGGRGVGQERLGGLTCIGAHVDDGCENSKPGARFLIVSKTRLTLMFSLCRRFAAQCESAWPKHLGGIKEFRGLTAT
jgi:hypothetical protein